MIEGEPNGRRRATGLVAASCLKAHLRLYIYLCNQTGQALTVSKAINTMRTLTDNGIPFSFEFISLNTTTNESNGVVRVEKALLRQNIVDGPDTVQAYTNLLTNQPRFCHYPLITKLNDQTITNEY